MSAGQRPHVSTVTVDRFVDCVIPGCRNPVDDTGGVCRPCRVAFGPYVTIRADRPPLTDLELADRDWAVRGACRRQTVDAAMDHLESKANRVCWLCGQRRTCTHRPHGWECRRCQGIT